MKCCHRRQRALSPRQSRKSYVIVASSVLLAIAAPETMAAGVDVISQNIHLAASANVNSDMPGAANDTEQSNKDQQRIGNQDVTLEARAASGSTTAFERETLTFRRIDTETQISFEAEATLTAGSELLPQAGENLNLNTSGSVALYLAFTTDRSYQYQLTLFPGDTNQASYTGGVTLNDSGRGRLSLMFDQSVEKPLYAEGRIDGWSHDLQWNLSSSVPGAVSNSGRALLLNPVKSSLTLKLVLVLIPTAPSSYTLAALSVTRQAQNRILLRMRNLAPGQNYWLDRTRWLDSVSWEVLLNFTAGSNAIDWTTNIDPEANYFYRLRF